MVNNAAGNTTTRSRTFTVTLDADSLKQLVTKFLGSGGPGNNGIINAMHQQIDNDSLNGGSPASSKPNAAPPKRRSVSPNHSTTSSSASPHNSSGER